MTRIMLKKVEADGLVNVDIECGCSIDDLAPCGEMGHDCQAARKCLGPPFKSCAGSFGESDWFEPMKVELED